MKKKIFLIARIVLMIVLLVLSIYFLTIIYKLDMLPMKIYMILICGFILFDILSVVGLLTKKFFLNIIAIILSIILIIVSILGIIHGTKIINFMNNAFNNNGIEVTAYNIVVLKSSEYNELKDLEEKTLGYNVIDDKYEDYIKTISKEVKVYFKSFESVSLLYEGLLNKKVDGIILTDGFIQLLEDDNEDLYDKVKVIYNFEIEEEVKPEPKEEIKLKPVNILISGSDSRTSTIADKTRSDVNMIVTINPNTHKILLTSIPRDYYVQLHGTTGLKDKLTNSGIYGINMTKKTLEDLFGIKINYTLKVGFQSVIKVVDLIGGVDIESDTAFTTNGGDGGAEIVKVKVGMNHFTGAQALSYARERYAYRSGDHHRIKNQQQVLEAVFNKIMSDKTILLKYDKILKSLKNAYKTSIPSDYIKGIVKEQLDSNPSWKIKKQQVSGGGYMRETYSAGAGRMRSVVIPDMDTVKSATEMINKVKNQK